MQYASNHKLINQQEKETDHVSMRALSHARWIILYTHIHSNVRVCLAYSTENTIYSMQIKCERNICINSRLYIV